MRSVVVKAGDTLSHIAQRELGNAELWPSLFRINADIIMAEQKRRGGKIWVDTGQFRGRWVDMSSDPARWIFPGTVLRLP